MAEEDCNFVLVNNSWMCECSASGKIELNRVRNVEYSGYFNADNNIISNVEVIRCENNDDKYALTDRVYQNVSPYLDVTRLIGIYPNLQEAEIAFDVYKKTINEIASSLGVE
jgi:hypothetical protein